MDCRRITVCFADVWRVSVRRYVYTMFCGRLEVFVRRYVYSMFCGRWEGFSSTLRLQYVWRRRRRNVRRYVYTMNEWAPYGYDLGPAHFFTVKTNRQKKGKTSERGLRILNRSCGWGGLWHTDPTTPGHEGVCYCTYTCPCVLG